MSVTRSNLGVWFLAAAAVILAFALVIISDDEATSLDLDRSASVMETSEDADSEEGSRSRDESDEMPASIGADNLDGAVDENRTPVALFVEPTVIGEDYRNAQDQSANYLNRLSGFEVARTRIVQLDSDAIALFVDTSNSQIDGFDHQFDLRPFPDVPCFLSGADLVPEPSEFSTYQISATCRNDDTLSVSVQVYKDGGGARTVTLSDDFQLRYQFVVMGEANYALALEFAKSDVDRRNVFF